MDQDQCIQFLEAYRNLPLLWNAKEKDYHNRNKKEDAWKEISDLMRIPVPILKAKMKNLMGTFRSERSRAIKKTNRSNGNGVYVSKWFAYKYFDFLSDRDAPRETTNSTIGTYSVRSEEPQEELDATVESKLSTPTHTTSLIRTPATASRRSLKTPSNSDPHRSHRSSIGEKSAKRKRVDQYEDARIPSGDRLRQSLVDVSCDPYKSYGQYITNELRKYDSHTLAMVKAAISNIIFKADVGTLSYDNPQPAYFMPDAFPQRSHGNSSSAENVSVDEIEEKANSTDYSSPEPSPLPPSPYTILNEEDTVSHRLPSDTGRTSENSFEPRHFVTGTRNEDSKMVSLKQVVSTLNRMAPLSLAESWDNVGLLVEPCVSKPITNVFLVNDLTESVMDEAETFCTDLIIVYHPPLFRPFKRINSELWKDRILARCLHLGIAVYSPHTSWDTVANGLSDWLISCFDGKVNPIIPINAKPSYSHSATFASVNWMDPENYRSLDGKQIKALLQEDIDLNANGNIRILDDSGSQLHILFCEDLLNELTQLAGFHKLHFHASSNIPLPSHSTAGSGRFCKLNCEESIGSIIPRLKKHLGVNNLLVALAEGATMESTIKTVAAVAGSGESVLEKTKADLFLTGEMSHHNILDATQRKTSIILTNHSNSERGYLKEFAKKLLGQIPGLNINISKVDKDPLEFV